MSNSFNNSAMIVNPILATFPADEVNIQPYWMVVLGLLANQLFQRIWHQFKYHTCFTTLEIAGLIRIFQQRLANQNSSEAWASSTVVSSKKTTGKITREKMRMIGCCVFSMYSISFITINIISCLFQRISCQQNNNFEYRLYRIESVLNREVTLRNDNLQFL